MHEATSDIARNELVGDDARGERGACLMVDTASHLHRESFSLCTRRGGRRQPWRRGRSLGDGLTLARAVRWASLLAVAYTARLLSCGSTSPGDTAGGWTPRLATPLARPDRPGVERRHSDRTRRSDHRLGPHRTWLGTADRAGSPWASRRSLEAGAGAQAGFRPRSVLPLSPSGDLAHRRRAHDLERVQPVLPVWRAGCSCRLAAARTGLRRVASGRHGTAGSERRVRLGRHGVSDERLLGARSARIRTGAPVRQDTRVQPSAGLQHDPVAERTR